MGLVNDTSYGKQKHNLVRDFEKIASSNHRQGMDTASSLAAASPSDVTKFLVNRESKGHTQVHADGCSYLGLHGLQDCACPLCLAKGTVISMISKLRAHFQLHWLP
jgi:hypothetical protein